MKKAPVKIVSFFCCFALLLSIFTACPPLKPGAASPESINLRIEGAQTTFASDAVPFTSGKSLYNIVTGYLKQKQIPYATSSQYQYISMINGLKEKDYQDASKGIYTGWLFACNGVQSAAGMADYYPKSNDKIVIYFGDFSQTMIPEIKIQPAYATAGQDFTISVTSSYVDWSGGVPDTKSVNVDGADIVFNGRNYKTESGKVTVAAPSAPGTYSLSVSKDRANNFPLLVRTGEIPVKVYSLGSLPTDQDDNLLSLSVTYGLSCTTGTVADEISKTVNGVTVRFPAGTQITGSSGWNGVVSKPELRSKSSVTIPGGFAWMVADLGGSDHLDFSKPVQIILPGQAGRLAGYYDQAGTFQPIRRASSALTQSELSKLADSACYDQGADLVIFTKHFTKFVSYSNTPSVSGNAVKAALSSGAAYLNRSSLTDWSAFALARAGYPVSQSFLNSLYHQVTDCSGNFANPNELSRTLLTLRAIGKNPLNIEGINLVKKLYTYDNIDKTGLNGSAYALLALDSGDYSVPSSANWNSGKLVSQILQYQNKTDGSFALSSGISGDPDMTAIAVTALSGHVSNPAVQTAVSRAISWLSARQTADGGYVPSGSQSAAEASESVSQTIIALSTSGIDPATDLRFIKNGKSLMDNLMSYKNADGGFSHLRGSSSDLIATQQAVMALNSYERFKSGSAALYDLTEAKTTVTQEKASNPATGVSGVPVSAVVISASALAGLILLTNRIGPEDPIR